VKEAPGRRVALITEDYQRPAPIDEILLPLLNILAEVGMDKDSVDLVVASGSHPPDDARLRKKLGDEVFRRVSRIIWHDHDAKDLVSVGTTSRGTPVWLNRTVASAGIRIGIGTVRPHHIAGFSGGGKIVLPGVVGRETIAKNHFGLMLQDGCGLYKTDGNPVWEDILEAARIAKLSMKIDVVLNRRKEIIGVFAGEPEAAQKRGLQLFKDTYGVFMPREPVDVAVVSGYPMEISLGQSSTAGVLGAASRVRDGGHIIVATAMASGVSLSRTLYDVLTTRKSVQELALLLVKGQLSPEGGPIAIRYRQLLDSRKLKISVVTDRQWKRQLEDMGLGYASSIQEAVDVIHKEVEVANVGVFPTAYFYPISGTDHTRTL
jgi:nickel-dependent lactate racemase